MKPMPRVLVLFGSKSDNPIVEPIMDALAKVEFEAQLEFVSAHRSPQRLDQLLDDVTFDLVVAGAGLAAHLPGVTASKIPNPVIGVPVNGAFGGLDALLSILQMPPGIPVLTVPVPNQSNSEEMWSELFERWRAVHQTDFQSAPTVGMLGDRTVIQGDLTKKARSILEHAAVKVEFCSEAIEGTVNIVAAPRGKVSNDFKIPKNCIPIYVPTYGASEIERPETAVDLLETMDNARPRGFWTGANNFVNAACIALEIFNIATHRYVDLLGRVKRGEFRG